ncbi:class A beta-lactamase-related serine hydrolase [Streptomyces sp. NBC_01142]|uniref:serine hydrolase n=1 Tax=Streptomyces sp. NBC_01142 TaxID=2975865 RepID=UPI00225A170F|nr:serine hydrolase [Streptomyces sp. NBC_01142]MCX4823662.1 class A beta-lactamase-related serine hydrolase [Streptomyces sp. NBC_01142]
MTAVPTPAARTRIVEAFADAGVTGQLYAADIDSGTRIAVGGDADVSTASVHKVCLVATLYREAAAGRIDLRRQTEIPAGARSAGPTGLGVMRDAARLSLRDLASLAVAVSDNAAADLLWDAVGRDTVNRTMGELGLRRTVAVQTMRELYASMAEDAGAGGAAALVDPAAVSRLRVLDPARTNRSTPREMAALLAAIWRDEVCEGARGAEGEEGEEYGAELRALLGLQAWSHRLASGFPFDDVRVSGKTGTLPTLRHEVGVVEYPDGGRYAVAVFTRAASTAVTLPAADAAIGRAARIAVDALRASALRA